jgi:hypothetical protein
MRSGYDLTVRVEQFGTLASWEPGEEILTCWTSLACRKLLDVSVIAKVRDMGD